MTAAPAGLGAGARTVFRWTVRVYWEDTDAGGIVFYANYLKYFERARTEWLRVHGVGQQALREGSGLMFVVLDTQVAYRAPARLDDELQVSVEPSREGAASVRFVQRAWRGPTLLAEGAIRVACVEAGTLRPRRLPPSVLKCLG